MTPTSPNALADRACEAPLVLDGEAALPEALPDAFTLESFVLDPLEAAGAEDAAAPPAVVPAAPPVVAELPVVTEAVPLTQLVSVPG
jgi:hypothetical protein